MSLFNIAIIGGGPAGYTAAEKAAKAGRSVVLFEKETLGGTCLNVGCIPTKTLLYSAKQYHNATHADKYGVQVAEASFDYAKMAQRKTKVVRKLVAGIKARLKDVTVVSGEAEVTSWSPERITIACGGEHYEAEQLLLCTGSTNFVPPIPGVNDNPCVWSSTEALAATQLPASVAIIGGGVIGMEFATLYMELGVPVTVVEALPTILPNIDADLVAALRTKYEKAGITFLTSARVTQVDGGTVHYQMAEQSGVVEAERILVCVGRRPSLAGLQALELEKDRNAMRVDEHMRTSLPNVYAAGDVTGKIMLAHVASRQAEVAISNMLGEPTVMSYKAVPSVVYTNPEIAAVGAAATEGMRVQSLPMTFSGRFVAENEGETGLCKLVIDPQTDAVVGAHMVGNPCSEFVAAAAIAIEQELTPEQLTAIIFPHPTVSEILKETAAS